MALLFMDSFDHYVTADILEKWTFSGGNLSTLTITSSAGRRSSAGFRIAWTSQAFTNKFGYIQKTLVPLDATAVMGFAFTVPVAGTIGTLGLPIAAIRDGSTTQVTLVLNSNLTLSVLRGNQDGTVLGTTTTLLASSGPTFVEWKVLLHPSAGTVDVRINGVSALSLTGQNTRNSTIAQWSSVVLGVITAINFTHIINTGGINDFDDLYVLDGSGSAPWNTFLGDCRIDIRAETAPGATTGWTPSAGANWQCVDDAAPNDDTDYVSALTVGLTDTYVVQDAPSPGATIYGVQHCISAKKADAGACLVAPVVRHAGVDYVGATAINPGTTYAYGMTMYPLNPATGAAWLEADFNAAEFGIKKTA